MRKQTNRGRRIILGAVAVAALMGGNAFTAANTAPASETLGYSSTTVSGGTVSSIAYNLNAAGDNINTVTLVLAGDTTASAVSIGFNGGTTTSCGTGTLDDPTTPTKTTYTCDNGGANFVQATSGLTATAVVIN